MGTPTFVIAANYMFICFVLAKIICSHCVSLSLKIICVHYVSLSLKIIFARCFVIAKNYMRVLFGYH